MKVPPAPIRDSNRHAVLEVLRRNQPISRVDIARRSGLQRSTVSELIEALLQEGWIREGSIIKTPRGRRPTMLTMNESLFIAVADIRPSQATLAAVDLNGRFIERVVTPVLPDPKQGAELLGSAIVSLLSRLKDKQCQGIGLSLPGRINAATQRLALAPNLGWVGFDLRSAIQRKTGLRVELENAANACLLSELWFGNIEGTQNVVLITVSEGLGSAVLVNGSLMTGASGLAGELGHIPVSDTGPRCTCGHVGCWEMFASSRAALRRYGEETGTKSSITIQELVSLGATGDDAAKKVLKQQAEAIGRGLRIVTATFDPELILFVGDITLRWDPLGTTVSSELKKQMLAGEAPKIAVLPDGESARLRGAAALVLECHSNYRRPKGNSR